MPQTNNFPGVPNELPIMPTSNVSATTDGFTLSQEFIEHMAHEMMHEDVEHFDDDEPFEVQLDEPNFHISSHSFNKKIMMNFIQQESIKIIDNNTSDSYYGIFMFKKNPLFSYVYVNKNGINKILLVDNYNIKKDFNSKGILLTCKFILKGCENSLKAYNNSYEKLRKRYINKTLNIKSIIGDEIVSVLTTLKGSNLNIRFQKSDIQIVYPSYVGFTFPKDKKIYPGSWINIYYSKVINCDKNKIFRVIDIQTNRFDNQYYMIKDEQGNNYVISKSSKIKKLDDDKVKNFKLIK